MNKTGNGNLIPAGYKFTREDQRAGGRASAEARKRRRDIRRALEDLLEKEYTVKNGQKLSGAEAIAVKQMEKALKGDTKAFAVVRDTAGQAPVQKIETTVIDDEARKEIEDFLNEKPKKKNSRKAKK
jgi:hypothetical protein